MRPHTRRLTNGKKKKKKKSSLCIAGCAFNRHWIKWTYLKKKKKNKKQKKKKKRLNEKYTPRLKVKLGRGGVFTWPHERRKGCKGLGLSEH
ncbi:hypothetical protein POVWA2_044300 [Plasmodium ovale wallikeri]|uniref:Uncharacterized protein n=1 Tax=Plasmodium ovale wallikeri TaxID=864142 RepID=A0A1A8ZFM5_PLAOA|nr:hypothetical protein POVWA2_044300 [Plasmodium ovale wallikeri]